MKASSASRPLKPRTCSTMTRIPLGLMLLSHLLTATASGAPRPQAKEKHRIKSMLVEPSELQRSLKEPGLRILDVRQKEAYDKGHIPRAVRVDVARWQELGRSDSGFRNAKAWGERVSELGVGMDSQVVVYGSSLPDTARIWWTLKYLGLENVTVLDGGWDLWVKEERLAETAASKVAPTQFSPIFDAERLAEIETLKGSLFSGKVKVVDARSKDEFTGKEIRGKRGGHIASATHLEWKELLAEDGRFKTPDLLREVFRERGILPDKTAVCY